MLILTRRPGEQIVIAGNIRLTIVNIGPGRVKIGIEAPDNVRVDRQEVFEKIQQEQAADVLHAVGQGADIVDLSPTIVSSASDTSSKLHNRIAEQLPADESVPTAARIGSPRVPKAR